MAKERDLLRPLLEAASRIMCDTDIDLEFTITSVDNGRQVIYWYVWPDDTSEPLGDETKWKYGDMHDWLYVNNLDCIKLERWIHELTAMWLDAAKES